MFKINISGSPTTYASYAKQTYFNALNTVDSSSTLADLIKAQNKAYLDLYYPDDVNPVYLNSIFAVNTLGYNSLNNNDKVKNTFTKYYYYKILDKWIYKKLFPLLAFIKIENGKPRLINSMSEYNIQELTTNSKEDIENKIDYMEKILLTKNMVKHVLKKICLTNNINWYDLNKYESYIKSIFYNYMLDKFKTAISSVSK